MTIADADNQVTTFTYDTRGLLLTSTDALNQTTTFTYDPAGRLLTTTDSLNRTTTLTYDSAGNGDEHGCAESQHGLSVRCQESAHAGDRPAQWRDPVHL